MNSDWVITSGEREERCPLWSLGPIKRYIYTKKERCGTILSIAAGLVLVQLSAMAISPSLVFCAAVLHFLGLQALSAMERWDLLNPRRRQGEV